MDSVTGNWSGLPEGCCELLHIAFWRAEDLPNCIILLAQTYAVNIWRSWREMYGLQQWNGGVERAGPAARKSSKRDSKGRYCWDMDIICSGWQVAVCSTGHQNIKVIPTSRNSRSRSRVGPRVLSQGRLQVAEQDMLHLRGLR